VVAEARNIRSVLTGFGGERSDAHLLRKRDPVRLNEELVADLRESTAYLGLEQVAADAPALLALLHPGAAEEQLPDFLRHPFLGEVRCGVAVDVNDVPSAA